MLQIEEDKIYSSTFVLTRLIMNRLFIFSFFLIFFFSCEKGNLLDNSAPETNIFVDEINLSGDQRLNSVVKLHWMGEDRDGYITKYELAVNGGEWTTTNSTDSTFRFDIPLGSDTIDILFQVRATDNLGLTDPTPAEVLIPIKNAPPIAKFDTLNVIPDSVFSVWSVLWSVDDLDGIETLDSTFIKINDGNWIGLDKRENYTTFIPISPKENNRQDAQIFSGLKRTILPVSLPGLKVGDDNRLYIRTRDIAGSFSPIDSTKSFFVKQQKSDFLVIDGHGSGSVDKVYQTILDQVSPGYDRIRPFQ